MNNQRGLTPLVILIIITILSVVGVVAYLNQSANQNKDSKTTVAEPSPSNSPTPTPTVTTKPIVVNKTATPTPTPGSTQSSSAQVSCGITSSASEGYAPLTVSLSQDIKSPNGPSGLQWDFDGNGSWDTDLVLGNYSPQHTYQKVGTYTVKLNVKTPSGDTTCTKTITVKPAGVECKVNGDNTTAPLEIEFAYEASMLGKIDNLDSSKDLVEAAQWDFDGNGSWDTSFDAASKRLKHTYSQAGNYTVKLQVRAQNNITSEVCTGSVTVQ